MHEMFGTSQYDDKLLSVDIPKSHGKRRVDNRRVLSGTSPSTMANADTGAVAVSR